MEIRHLSWVLLALWGCATSGVAPRPAADTSARPGVVFVEDDYGAALRQAREKRQPIFVEVWAPWCVACRAMRATVLGAPELEAYGGRFQWLAVDMDNPANEGFLSRFPVDTLPNVLIIDPERETLLARSLGVLSASQLAELLTQAERTFHQGLRETEERIVRAHALAAEGSHAEAVEAYQQVLSRLAKDEPQRAGIVVALLKALLVTGRPEECMRLAARELAHLPRTDDRARVLYPGGGCALDVETAEAAAMRALMAEETARAIAAPAEALVPIVRSSLYESLIELRIALGQEAEVKATIGQWLTFLEASAEQARNAEERAWFDPHWMMAAMMLEQPERAIPAIERSERALPDDYNPPARLSVLHMQAGKLEQALQASDRALARAKGTGRGKVLAGRSRILLARGERAQAERMLTDALQELKGLPEGTATRQQRRVLEEALKFVMATGG